MQTWLWPLCNFQPSTWLSPKIQFITHKCYSHNGDWIRCKLNTFCWILSACFKNNRNMTSYLLVSSPKYTTWWHYTLYHGRAHSGYRRYENVLHVRAKGRKEQNNVFLFFSPPQRTKYFCDIPACNLVSISTGVITDLELLFALPWMLTSCVLPPHFIQVTTCSLWRCEWIFQAGEC